MLHSPGLFDAHICMPLEVDPMVLTYLRFQGAYFVLGGEQDLGWLVCQRGCGETTKRVHE